MKRCRFNVEGRIFETTEQTLRNVSDTYFTLLLDSPMETNLYSETGHFIDRSSDDFALILNYLRRIPIVSHVIQNGQCERLYHEALYYSLVELQKEMMYSIVDVDELLIDLTKDLEGPVFFDKNHRPDPLTISYDIGWNVSKFLKILDNVWLCKHPKGLRFVFLNHIKKNKKPLVVSSRDLRLLKIQECFDDLQNGNFEKQFLEFIEN